MSRSKLRPYQQAAIARFRARADRRIIFAHATSAGKTRTAIESVFGAKQQPDGEPFQADLPAVGCNILVICPAIARPVWIREFGKWSNVNAGAIRFGTARKSVGSKKNMAEAAAALAAQVKVVSYRLAKEALSFQPAPGWLILDELHALRNPLSQQSKIVRSLLTKYPGIPAIGLTATLIPTDVRQIWNPLDTFWPGQWGKPHPAGDVSWAFQAQYCGRIENEYGVRYEGARSPEALQALGRRLEPYVHRVTDKEVAPYLPPLHAEPLYLDEKRDSVQVAKEWLEGVEPGEHVVVLCFHRELAGRLAEGLEAGDPLTGEQGVEARQRRLDAFRDGSGGVLVATSESVRESISLSFARRALIFEWRTSPAQAIQLMGRFPRQDAVDLTRPTHIQYIVGPGDEARAELLRERIAAIQQVMAADRKSEQLVELFKPRELTEERLDRMFSSMMNTTRLDEEWNNADT